MMLTMIVAPEELLRQLRRIAAERGVSVATLTREALREKAKRHRPRPRSLGIGDSDHADEAHRTGQERPLPRSWR